MNYEDRVLCFLDILGFSSLIKGTVDQYGADDKGKIAALNQAFAYVRTVTAKDASEQSGTVVTQFSDSVVISFPVTEQSGVFWTLLTLLWVQVGLISHGILCRGAVVRGKVVHTSEVLFGPAMVDAYALETKAAVYPRVILDESIINLGEKFHAFHHLPEQERDEILKLVDKDADGMYYIDYFTQAQSELNDPEYDFPDYLLRMRDIIEKGLQVKDSAVRVKYLWMKEKFAPYLKRVKVEKTKNESDEDLRFAYSSIPNL